MQTKKDNKTVFLIQDTFNREKNVVKFQAKISNAFYRLLLVMGTKRAEFLFFSLQLSILFLSDLL